MTSALAHSKIPRPIAVVGDEGSWRKRITAQLSAWGLAPYAPDSWPDASAHLLWLDGGCPARDQVISAPPHCPVVIHLRAGVDLGTFPDPAWAAVTALVADDERVVAEVADALPPQAPRPVLLSGAEPLAVMAGELLDAACPPPTLSASVLTTANEARLRRCLASIADVVDELVVQVDARTEGDAARVAAEFTDPGRIHVEVPPLFDCDPPRIHFAEARNRGLDRVSGDWCLVIDADEELINGTLLREAVAHASWTGLDAVAVRVDCHTDIGPAEVAMSARLFRRCDSIRWRHPVHNQLMGADAVLTSPAVIRSSYEGAGALADRVARAVPALLAMFEGAGEGDACAATDQEAGRAHAAFYLCRSYAAVHDHAQVIRWARKCQDLCGDHPTIAPMWAWWAEAELHERDRAAARAVVDAGLERHPGFADLWHMRVGLDLMDWADAAASPGPHAATPQRSPARLADAGQAARLLGLPISVGRPAQPFDKQATTSDQERR